MSPFLFLFSLNVSTLYIVIVSCWQEIRFSKGTIPTIYDLKSKPVDLYFTDPYRWHEGSAVAAIVQTELKKSVTDMKMCEQ